MKRVVLLFGSLSLSALAVQACSDSTDDPGDGVEAGASSGGSSGARNASSGGGAASGSSSSGGSSSSSSSGGSSSSSSGDAQSGDRCIEAANRAQARYEACDMNVPILDGGTPEACTDARAADGERIADCVDAASCPALRGQADASAESEVYYQCLAL